MRKTFQDFVKFLLSKDVTSNHGKKFEIIFQNQIFLCEILLHPEKREEFVIINASQTTGVNIDNIVILQSSLQIAKGFIESQKILLAKAPQTCCVIEGTATDWFEARVIIKQLSKN